MHIRLFFHRGQHLDIEDLIDSRMSKAMAVSTRFKSAPRFIPAPRIGDVSVGALTVEL